MLLNDANIDPDTEDYDSRTALQAAATYGKREAIIALLEAGADRYHLDKNGISPIAIARKRGFFDLADVNSRLNLMHTIA